MHCRSPREFLKRLYHRTNQDRYFKKCPPNVFPRTRIGQIKWVPDQDYKKIHDSLLAKEHLIIS